ncbi:ankyrin repeat protein [Colletotrichum tofieldiae]|uniref:Ankyrin repeat protein n=1 Tax=Colletotrichum tofieldiae TaxID=708197 RepID=A0A166X9L2_9PEZI|nr:ankyrin repeat protein [Colletotrichum tofieldiae]
MQAFIQGRHDLQELIRKGSINVSKGMFLLAQLTIDSLSTKTTAKALRHSIDRFNTGGGAYSRIYDEAMQRIRVQPPDHWQLAEQILGWITNAKRPLKLVELQHALAFEKDAEEIDGDNIPSAEVMISVCAGLVTINEDSDIIRLVHQTTQEYFDERKHDLFQDFSSEMTTTCVGYLSFDFCRQYRRDDLGKLWSWKSTTQDLAFRDSCLPFYEYAALNWGRHARDSGKAPCGVAEFICGKGVSETYLQVLKELIKRRPFYLHDAPQKSSHLAAYFGILQLFENYTLSEDETYSTDAKGRTALWWAAHQGHEDVVEYLLNSCAIESTSHDIHSRSLGKLSPSRFSLHSLRSALREAPACGHFDVFQTFVDFCSKKGLDIEVEGDAEKSIFYKYIRAGDLLKIELLLKITEKLRFAPIVIHGHKTNDNSKFNGANAARAAAPPYFIQNGLHDAIESLSTKFSFEDTWDKFYSELIQTFLDHGAEFRASDSLRDGPGSSSVGQDRKRNCFLNLAVLYGLGETVKVVLNHAIEEGPALLKLASYYGSVHIVELLLQYKVNVEADNELGRTSPTIYRQRRRLRLRKTFSQYRAKTEATDTGGRTPPTIARQRGHLRAEKIFLWHRAKIEATDTGGRTPLTLASQEGHLPIMNILLEHGAKIEARDTDGRTPLIAAIDSKWTNLSTATMLLEHGAQVEATDKRGRNPLIAAIASKKENLSIVNVLLEHGAKIDVTDIDGRTPLMVASKWGHLSIIKVLLEHGAQINATDTVGRTALMWAMKKEQHLARKLLLDKGAKVTTCTEKTVKITHCGDCLTALQIGLLRTSNGY